MSALIRFGESVFPYLLDAAWKGTALMVMFFVLARVLGKRHLTARYWLWVYCLVGLLLLPVISFVARNYRLALLPAKEHTVVARLATESRGPVSGVIDFSPVAEVPDGISPSEAAPAVSPAENPGEEPPTIIVARNGAATEASTMAPRSGTQSPRAQTAPTTASPFLWRGWISLVWLAGCAIFLLRLLFAALCITRLRRSSSPVFTGIFRPAILLPESVVREMPPEQLRPILLHELAHVRWRDYAVNLLQRLSEAIFFFHPFIYLMNRRLRRLREEICDNWVLNHSTNATVYARALTTLAERRLVPRKSLVGVGVFYHALRLRQRIERILASGGHLSMTLRFKTRLVLLALSLVIVGTLSFTSMSARAVRAEKNKPSREVEGAIREEDPVSESAISWKDDTVYRDGKPYAKIVQWEPEADLPMIAFGDQNNNSKTDTWIRFLKGKALRIEIDGNEDGRIDKWEHYFQGLIDLVEVDTDFNRRVDLWRVYDKGKLFREEIDEDADGSVDKWLEINDQGKLVEKEIFSWTGRIVLTMPRRRVARVTFFNARDRVRELKAGAEFPKEGSGTQRREPGGRGSSLRYWASAGSRLETLGEVQGRSMVNGWYHMPVAETEPWREPWSLPAKTSYWYTSAQVRHSAVDRGLDGGVDSWAQLGPPAPEVDTSASRPARSLFRVRCDDTNRDGMADRCEATLERDAATRQAALDVKQTDSNGDGLVDKYHSTCEKLKSTRADGDHDGVFDAFAGEGVSWYAEPVGTSELELESKLVAGHEQPCLLCELSIAAETKEFRYGRTFWLKPGETRRLVKLSRGMYDLTVYVPPFQVARGAGYRYPHTPGPDPGTTTFSYPSFVQLDQGESASRALSWDPRLAFRGRLISEDAAPLAYKLVSATYQGKPAVSVQLITDAAGDFDLFNIPQGRYAVSSFGNFGKRFEETIDVPPAGDGPGKRQYFLTSAQRGVDAERRGEIPAGWKAPVAVSGRILSHDGLPLPNMLLLVISSGSRRTLSREAVSGLDGRYEIFALPPGQYSISVYNNDFRRRREPIEQFDVQIEKTPMRKDFRLSGPMPVAVE